MKQLIAFSFICTLFLFSCKKKDDAGPIIVPPDPVVLHKVSFGFTVANDGGRIAVDENATPTQIRLSITDDQESPVLTDEVIDLSPFGSSFISTPLELEEGDYLLTAFVVLDNTGKVMYASPLEGSEKAYLVNDPLPMDFTVDGDVLNIIDPEVLPIAEPDTPAQFGYLSYSFNVVPTFYLDLLAVDDSDGTNMITDVTIRGYNANDEVLLETVTTTDSESTLAFELLNEMEYYEFQVDHQGYHPLTYAFDTDILMARENPLEFILSSTSEFAMIPVWEGIKGQIHKEQQNVFIFIPLNGCSNDMRIDFGGITPGQFFSLDIYIISTTTGLVEADGLDVDLLPGDHDDGGIYQLDQAGSIGSLTNFCELPAYADLADLQVAYQVYIPSGANEIEFNATWDNAAGQWTEAAQTVWQNGNVLLFEEYYDLND